MKKDIGKIDKNSLKKDLEKIWNNNKNDPYGSYVGNSQDEKRPIQDADDL